jgi:hypothetical protein
MGANIHTYKGTERNESADQLAKTGSQNQFKTSELASGILESS